MTRDATDSQGQRSANTRLDIARALTHVVGHRRTIEWVRAERPQWLQSSLHSELLYGTLRHYLSLTAAIQKHLKRPLKKKDLDLQNLLLVGAYQLQHTAVADYAAINECVDACRGLGKPWAKGLVNGVLRALQRQERIEPATEALAERDHPEWLRILLHRQYGKNALELMEANNRRAPMTLRINQIATRPDVFKQRLKNANIPFTDGPWEETVTLLEPQVAADLPGWTQGECAVQDQAAQHAAHLIISALRQKNPNASPIKVLDACAAPGGKLFHVREALTQEHIAHYLFALDNKATRLQELSEIATRLGHATHAHADGSTQRTESIGLICADGCATDLPFPDPFDVILIDAPCSGSGTIRRNPDIRMLLSQKVLLEHQVLQRQLLQNLWQRLMPGGTLVYSTCSVFSEENDQVIQSFLGSTADALVVRPSFATGRATQHGCQLLPTEPLTDGFYYCVLEKGRHYTKANSP